jgi:hypothetical protein
MDEEKERALFERWYKEHARLPPTYTFRRIENGTWEGGYANEGAERAWESWRARAEIA